MSATIDDALAALLHGPRHAIADAAKEIPATPGLYAVFTDRQGAADLGLESSVAPIYVGKAERSLLGRDVMTHFASGKTGSSTLRRSAAALLRDQLRLRAVPRNLARPDGSANFSLEPDSDQRLTNWMCDRMTLAVWPTRDAILDEVETDVLSLLRPALNLSKMGKHASPRVKAARAVMAAEARTWTASSE